MPKADVGPCQTGVPNGFTRSPFRTENQNARAASPSNVTDTDMTDAALRVLLSVQETNEMAAMKEQNMRFKKLYPHLFLTDADVGSAVFCATVCDDDTHTCARTSSG